MGNVSAGFSEQYLEVGQGPIQDCLAINCLERLSMRSYT